jgi:hypothetical protein
VFHVTSLLCRADISWWPLFTHIVLASNRDTDILRSRNGIRRIAAPRTGIAAGTGLPRSQPTDSAAGLCTSQIVYKFIYLPRCLQLGHSASQRLHHQQQQQQQQRYKAFRLP